MAKESVWLRQSNVGLRPGAEVEFAIDLQLTCLEGCRIFETKNDVPKTLDWLSSRFLIKAYLERDETGPVFNADLADRAVEASACCV